VLVALAVWLTLGMPGSYAEARFLHRLESVAAGDLRSVPLDNLMAGDWELVCDAHCYNGGIRLSRYNKSFPSIGACTEEAWGLLFISNDGSYTSAGGRCGGSSTSVYIKLNGCIAKEQAVLRRTVEPFLPCPSFVINGG
jgi:hypothetical protein